MQLKHHLPYMFLFLCLLGMKLMLGSMRPPPSQMGPSDRDRELPLGSSTYAE